jgi:MraZ protein
MLIGEYSHSLDDKKRLSLPAKFRKTLGKKVVMTRGLDSCIFVFTTVEWEKIAQKLSEQSVGSRDARDLNRFFLSGASEVEVDSSGRVLVPEYLKTFAKLESKVTLAGLYSRVEIWDDALWQERQKAITENADDVASKLQEVGMM